MAGDEGASAGALLVQKYLLCWYKSTNADAEGSDAGAASSSSTSSASSARSTGEEGDVTRASSCESTLRYDLVFNTGGLPCTKWEEMISGLLQVNHKFPTCFLGQKNKY
jgi:hypothetical protein